MKLTFIYGLFDPRDLSAPRYIGKTNEPRQRLNKHLSEAKNYQTSKNNWLLSLVREGIIPQLMILQIVPTCFYEAYETSWIVACRLLGIPILNSMNGGAGCKADDIWRKKQSKIAKAKFNDPEWKKQHGETISRYWKEGRYSNSQYKRNESAKRGWVKRRAHFGAEAISASRSEQMKRDWAEGKHPRQKSTETRRKMSESAKKYWSKKRDQSLLQKTNGDFNTTNIT